MTATLEKTDDLIEQLDSFSKRSKPLPKSIPNTSLAWQIIKKIPLASKFFRKTAASGSSLHKLGTITTELSETAANTRTLGKSFKILSLITSIADFFRIPAIYLGAFILGQKIPFTLTNNAKFIYASVLLALAICSFVFPVAAVYIAIASACLALTTSLINLTLSIVKTIKVNRALKSTEATYKELSLEFMSLKEEALELTTKYKNASKTDKDAIEHQIKKCLQDATTCWSSLEDATNTRHELRHKKNTLGLIRIIDTSISVGVALLSLIAVVVAIYLPPVGLALLASSAAIGASYFAFRIMRPFVKLGFLKVFNKLKTPSNEHDDPLAIGHSYSTLKKLTDIPLQQEEQKDKNGDHLRFSAGLSPEDLSEKETDCLSSETLGAAPTYF